MAALATPRQRQGGAGILLIILVAFTLGLSVLFGRIGGDAGSYGRERGTGEALATARSALIGFAASYREQVNGNRVWGYLPCIDSDNDGNQITNSQLEVCTADPGDNHLGRFPYAELGLTDLRDSAAECLWYAVSGSHKLNNDASPMNWDLRAGIRVEDPAGIALADPADPSGGAAAVVFAPGPPLTTQNRSGGTNRCPGDTTNGFAAWLDGPGYANPVNGTMTVRQGVPKSDTNNDLLAWISPKELWDTIARRGDLYTATDTTLLAVRDCLNAQPSLPSPPGLVDNGVSDHVKATALTLPGCGAITGFVADLWENWRDHVRYVRCDVAGVTCLTVNGTACEGALVFGGRHVSGNPRTAAQLNDLASYFEGGNLTSLQTSGGVVFTDGGGGPYSPSNQARDSVYCLDSLATPPITFGDPVQVTAIDFGLGLGSMSGFDSATRTLRLGEQDLDTGATGTGPTLLFGCAWVGGAIPFGNGIRAYFRFRIREDGEGFTFAIIDADRNVDPATLPLCGAGGSRLGYAGDAAASLASGRVRPLSFPKLGVEFDTDEDGSRNDPDDEHVGVVYWGNDNGTPWNPAIAATSVNLDDDNVHGAPAPAAQDSNVEPQNPDSPSSGVVSDPRVRTTNQFRHVRVELFPTTPPLPANGLGNYTVRVWVSFLDATDPPVGMNDTTVAYAADPPDIERSFAIGYLPGTATAVMQNVRLGFTNGASSEDQEIEITNFEARRIP